MFDPEEMETAMSQALQTAVGSSWTVAPTDYSQLEGGAVVVKYEGLGCQPQFHGDDPRTSVLSATEAEAEFLVRFISAPQAPRGVFNGLIEKLVGVCRELAEGRREEWAVQSIEPQEVKEESEAPTRALDFTVTARFVLEA